MNVVFIIIGILAILYILKNVKDGKFSIVESIFWVSGGFAILILSIFPVLVDRTAKFIGIDYTPSLLFVLSILFLLFINFRNSQKIAKQQEKIIELAQKMALLKDSIDEKKTKK